MKFRLYKIYRKLHKRIRIINASVINFFLFFTEALTGTFITYHMRPSTGAKLECSSDNANTYPRSAIVIQGPVAEEKNFTLETIRIYKKYFPQAIIVLSTWNDTDPAVCENIRKENIEVLLNAKPTVAGYKNINFQIVSTSAGVRRAKQLGAEYMLKTRTDQRFYNPRLLYFLYKTIHAFPVFMAGTRQKKRLIFSSASKRSQYRFYYASDMMMFGCTNDMDAYWHVSQVTSETMGSNAPEQYLMTEFLKHVGHEPMHTLDDSLSVFAHFCIILDLSMLDFYWFKYERYWEYKDVRYDGREAHNFSFLEWLGLCADREENQ